MNTQFKKTMEEIGAKTQVCFRVVFADGSSWQNRERAPDVTILIRNGRAAWRVLLFGHVGFLEGYFDGDIDIEGSIAHAFRAGMDAGFDGEPTFLVKVRNWWHEFRYSNASISQAKANARFHYGPGQDFYREWLDEVGMAYTCSWFADGSKTLEEAQLAKMDHVCRKVLLKEGDTFADIGSGWGNLLFYAWDKYRARGTGINTTTEQVQETRAEIKRRGLEGKVEVLERDFRQVPRQFDKLLSIGTLEHAGRDQLPEVIRAHAEYLKPGGLGVLHFIGHVGMRDTEFWIRKYIFPGGWIPSLAPGGRGHREPAAQLRADAGRLGAALRPQLGEGAQAQSREVRREVQTHLAHLPVVVRRDVPPPQRQDAPLPDRGEQGQRRRELSDEPRLPLHQ